MDVRGSRVVCDLKKKKPKSLLHNNMLLVHAAASLFKMLHQPQ